MGEIKFIGSLLMTALFGIAIMTFAINFAGENNVSYSLDDDFNSTLQNSKGSLTVYHGNISASSDAFATSELGLIDAFKTGGVFKKGGVSAIASTKNILKEGYRKLFGTNNNFAIFLNTLFAFLSFVLIRYVYKSWVGRNPD